MYVEASKSNFTDKLTGQFNITGNVGKVMGESCNIALTHAKHFITNYLLHLTETEPRK